MSTPLPPIENNTSELVERLDAIYKVLVEQRSYDAAREEAFEALHKDLVSQRVDREFLARRGFIKRMIRFYQRLVEVRWLAEAEGQSIDRYDDLLETLLEGFAEEDILPIPSANTFDNSIHHAVAQSATDNPALDGRIVQIHRQGFTYRGKIVAETEVTVFRFIAGSGA